MSAVPAEEALDDFVVRTVPWIEMARMRAATSPRRLPGHGPAGDSPASTLRWCNVFTHAHELLGAGGSRVVTPNNDTLYSNAWLDLGQGPLWLDLPATGGRYMVLGFLDFHTNPFAHLGTRCTGTGALRVLVSGPGWRGVVPEGVHHVAAPTRWAWIIGRLLVDGPADLPAVHALQDGLVLRPAEAGVEVPRRFDAGVDPKAPVDADAWARLAACAAQDSPLPPDEQAGAAAWHAGGLLTAQPLSDALRPALQRAIERTLARLRAADPVGRRAQGWTYLPPLESGFGGDATLRALIALKYIGALESREAVYPMAWHDAEGQALDGRRRYEMRFPAGGLPPVDAFWSLTVYDARDCMLVPNPIDRYAIGDRTPGLVRGDDGSLTISLSHEAPVAAAARANWLPLPSGPFYLCLRAYLPRPALLDGGYVLPGLMPVEARA